MRTSYWGKQVSPTAKSQYTANVRTRRLDADGLWEYAVRCLAGRAYSVADLKRKLRLRAERVTDVDPAVARLKELGYLNDTRFADSYAAARLSNQGLGKRRVIRDLRERGIAPKVVESAIQRVYAESDETGLIEEYLRRRFRWDGKSPLFEDAKSLASAYGKMLRAGFDAGATIAVLKRLTRAPDLADHLEPPEEGEESPL